MTTSTTTDRTSDDRRSFLRKSLAARRRRRLGRLVAGRPPGRRHPRRRRCGRVADGGRHREPQLLAAAELVEDDLRQQYDELARDNQGYNIALRRIDRSLVRYIGDDRHDDERRHAKLISAYVLR